MNVAKFVVLGTLERMSPASGYDVIRDLEKKMISRWTNIKKGSVYHALKVLQEGEYIIETERVKRGSYPTMTLYQITDKGREAFDKMQVEAFLGLYPYYFGFKLALKFNVRRSPAEIAYYAGRAIKKIDAQIQALEAYIDGLADTDSLKESDSFFIEHDKMLLRTQKEWILMAVEKVVMF